MRVVNLLGNGSEPDSGSPQVIMRRGVSQGTSTSLCRPLTVSVTSRHTRVYYCRVVPILCIIAERALKMTHFSQTGGNTRNQFLTLVSYSTSTCIVILGLRRLLLPFLFREGPDLENFAQNRHNAVFVYKEASLSTSPFRVEHRSVIKIKTLHVMYEF